MTDKKEDNKATEAPVTDIVTYNGKEFDLASEAGRNQLKGYLEATSQGYSRKANENHDIKISLGMPKTASIDEVKAKIAALKAEGRDEEAEQATVDLAVQTQAKLDEMERRRIEEEWFEQYKAHRPEFFEVLPEALAKDALFGKYGYALHTHANPVVYADQILSSYMPSDEPKASVGASKAAPVREEPSPKKEEPEDNFNILDAINRDFGKK